MPTPNTKFQAVRQPPPPRPINAAKPGGGTSPPKEVNARVRTLVNFIIEGTHIPYDSILNLADIPLHMRHPDYYEVLSDPVPGRVLLLKPLTYPRPTPIGGEQVLTSYPATIAAGEVIQLDDLPLKVRQRLVEGEDYTSDFDLEKWLAERHSRGAAEEFNYDEINRVHYADDSDQSPT